ncbi:hypothetical protein [Pseudoruegeria sp. SK021]|uniref:hypothetical protein n=1 Tax=Pseudoruegeria sp. SK021 TaxID=1933035 RepID=UPI00111C172A|nr:hypothetical protein [Pseudoruegeria sp. SK021]
MMTRLLAVFAVLMLANCQPVKPTAGASVGSTGPDARVGAKSGRVGVSAGTDGVNAGVNVVQTENVSVGVGTGGVGASAKVGNGPVRVGWGLGGWRIGI